MEKLAGTYFTLSKSASVGGFVCKEQLFFSLSEPDLTNIIVAKWT